MISIVLSVSGQVKVVFSTIQLYTLVDLMLSSVLCIYPSIGTGSGSMATITIHLFINSLININITVLVLSQCGRQVC